MNEFHGAATRRIAADPEAVFDLVTDLDRLPEWNATVDQITERPASLAVGAEWVAVMHPRRSPSWKSRSTVEDIDRDRRCFVYKSRNEDGNPSYARWTWEVVPAGDDAEVTVRWAVYLKTLDRKLIAAPIRRRGLAREVPASLDALDTVLRTRSRPA
jgi:uncharacterized protein YndB with AHSA1/START domain